MENKKLIQKCIDILETRLTSNVCFEKVAETIGLSRFHFHRVFVKHTGYTPKQYLRKRRLSKAASELCHTFFCIPEIAKKYQFCSQESFTRAIKKEFGITPGKIRKTKHPFAYTYRLFLFGYNNVLKGATMKPQIITMEPKKVVGMEVSTTMKENKIPQLWTDFMPRFNEIKPVENAAYGVCYPCDCTEKCEEMGEDSEFKYLACAEVENFDNIPEKMKTYTIPGGKYAIFTHKGSLDTLGDTYDSIFGKWMGENNLEYENRGSFELYDDRFKYGEDESIMEIFVPVK